MLKIPIPRFAGWLLLALGTEVAAYSDVRFEHLSLEHGLAQSSVQDMVHDELGYMWFGTQYGLSRYDGYGFRNFRHRPEDPSSLSNSRIQDLLRATDGSIWVATRSGLNRLDPETLRIERILVESSPRTPGIDPYPPITGMAEGKGGDLIIRASSGVLHYDRSAESLRPVTPEASASKNALGAVIADARGRLWLLNSQGLWQLEPDEPRLRHVLNRQPAAPAGERVSIALMPSGRLVLSGERGVTFFDPDRERVVDRLRPTRRGRDRDRVSSVAVDSSGSLWLLTERYLAEYRPDNDHWTVHLERGTYGGVPTIPAYRLSVERDQNGFAWVGLPEGVGLAAPDGSRFRLLQHDPNDPESVSASPWSSVYKVGLDAFGVIWVGGGLGGLSRFAPQQVRFERVIDTGTGGPFGVDNVIRSVLEVEHEGEQTLWTGLGSSGLRVWRREDGGFRTIVAELSTLADKPFRLLDNQVWELARHPETGEVWAGTNKGLVVISPDDYSVQQHVPVRIEGRPVRIKAMKFSNDGTRLWAGGGKRLMVFELGPDGRVQQRTSARSAAPDHVTDNEHGIFEMIRLQDGRLLVGTRRGLVLWAPHDDEIDHEYPASKIGEHPRNFIFGLTQTRDGRIWIGTEQAGLGVARISEREFTAWNWYDQSDGLPDDTVYAILPSASGRLWLSSNRGLARFNPESGIVRQFTLADGLQALEFNNTVATIGDSGRFYFGGIRGVNAFRPDAIELDGDPPRIFLQRARIGGRAIELDAGATAARAKTSHDNNNLVAEFVGLHFVQPERIRYAYRLSGVDSDWVESQSVRLVRYPDLPPGEYTLTVKAANSDGVWSGPKELLAVTVAAPPWMMPWAYALYVFTLALLIGLFLLAGRRRRLRLEHEVEQRTRELRQQKELVDTQAGELEEMLNARTMLFANISHEFRTPLTLIDSSLDRLTKDPADSGAIMAARRYLGRLLRLVDQLLNLSRLQSARRQPPPPVPWSLDQVVTMTVEAFRPLAEEKGIVLDAAVDGRWLTQCQQADVERILLNLIGNALKYCPSGSRVDVELADAEGGVSIIVRDDGPGIDGEQQGLIFERFNRMPAHEHGRIEGAGIGLTLVREAARYNGGYVDLESRPGQGSEFRVWLPAWRGQMEGAPLDRLATPRLELELDSLMPDHVRGAPISRDEERDAPTHGFVGVALVVEDNADLRRHLAESLSAEWQVMEAADGVEALRMAREKHPDVVVSDIMMPRLDGLELLRRLREDVRTSHLPVLLLTARQDEATRLQGYSLSADDFLSKPFKAAELRLRLRRMADIRARIRARLRRQMETSGQSVDPEEAIHSTTGPDLSQRDEQFLERVRGWLQANHDDPEAGVAELAAFLSVEQRTLQRKLKALTGRTPADHLQRYRIESARRLLAQTSHSIQQVAYSCGFSSPQYFSRVFTRQQGMSPSKWRAKTRESS